MSATLPVPAVQLLHPDAVDVSVDAAAPSAVKREDRLKTAPALSLLPAAHCTSTYMSYVMSGRWMYTLTECVPA